MVNIPAFCDTCGAAFPSGFAFENCRNVHLQGNKSGPCPRCGGVGSVLDGVFNITGNVIEVLAAPSRTKEQLELLSQILRSAVENEKEADEIASEIQSNAPNLSAIARFIPKNSAELVAWLTFVLLAIQTLMQMDDEETPDVNVIFNHSVEQSMNPKNYYPYRAVPEPMTRNSPCPCGSGERYKRCCGRGI